MLTGIYGYIFGGDDSNDSLSFQENIEPCTAGGRVAEDDWCFVEDVVSGRSSPVLIQLPDVRDIDSLSFSSKKATPPPSADAIRKSEELRQAKAVAAHRLQLERVLFADAESPLSLVPPHPKTTLLESAGKLKRASASAMVASESKTKSRSKRSAKVSSGRNNDRKVNNLD